MGFSFRKSFGLLPGVKVNLSRRGPRLSIGIPGARASVGLDGKTRIYGNAGPLRYQKAITIGANRTPSDKGGGLLGFLKGILGGQ
jgi:hypothetical protein